MVNRWVYIKAIIFSHVLIPSKDKWSSTVKIITLYYRVYDVFRCKVYDNNSTKDGGVNGIILLKDLTVCMKWYVIKSKQRVIKVDW